MREDCTFYEKGCQMHVSWISPKNKSEAGTAEKAVSFPGKKVDMSTACSFDGYLVKLDVENTTRNDEGRSFRETRTIGIGNKCD